MRLSTLIEAVDAVRVYGDTDRKIKGIAYDSRSVENDFVFFCVRGGRFDGRGFIRSAIESGAVAVIGEEIGDFVVPEATFVEVNNLREAMAEVADLYYGHPARRLGLIGITGTNGKTTTSYLVRSVLETAGRKAGLIGTVEYITDVNSKAACRTTPESVDLQRYLSDMVAVGMKYGVLEVSSHALMMERVHGCKFKSAVFTNLTQDHLDFHGSMEDYFMAKSRLFSQVEPDGVCVINLDDEYGSRLASSIPAGTNILGYSMGAGADIGARNVETELGGTRFVLIHGDREYRVSSPLLGRHNVSNMLAAFGVGVGLDLPVDLVLDGITSVENIPGRFERIDRGQDFLVIVDYAHTDDALERAVLSARSLTKGRVITLFGCGGERDRGKRPKMGRAATLLSDYVLITSDNSRGESPENIFRDIKEGISRYNYLVINDREKAIRHAVMIAGPGDVVLIAGKGHEVYQETAGVRAAFSDRETAGRCIDEKLGNVVG